MANKVIYTHIFTRKVKDLKRKHFSLIDDLEKLAESLIENPKQGVDLGGVFLKSGLQLKVKERAKAAVIEL